ncbi:hypothetical protein CCMA1212_005714 [Trichoderma ghanense]|uniref:Uncharacterized protein n=1 Tax=Trichoderma ghanense TaxID=65468 RepID=A0ABY2H484_9HYPO
MTESMLDRFFSRRGFLWCAKKKHPGNLALAAALGDIDWGVGRKLSKGGRPIVS